MTQAHPVHFGSVQLIVTQSYYGKFGYTEAVLRIRSAFDWLPNPDSLGVESTEIEGENEAKRHIILHKKLIQCTKAYLRQ
jgi:hypothetical protein